jgi:hypothetical protein
MRKKPLRNVKPDGQVRKRKNIKAGLVFMTVIIALYAVSFVNMLINKDIKTDIIQKGIIYDSVSANAIFIRNEEVLISDAEGFYIREIDEGSHVKAFSSIITILSDNGPALAAELSRI